MNFFVQKSEIYSLQSLLVLTNIAIWISRQIKTFSCCCSSCCCCCCCCCCCFFFICFPAKLSSFIFCCADQTYAKHNSNEWVSTSTTSTLSQTNKNMMLKLCRLFEKTLNKAVNNRNLPSKTTGQMSDYINILWLSVVIQDY